MHTSTTFHLIKTLIVLSYVCQDNSRRYRIGPRLFMQAAGAFNEIELVNLATPHLQRLAEETGETTQLAVRADAGIAVIAKVDAREQRHVGEMLCRRVLDALLLLMRRAGRGDRADRPRGRTAEFRVLFEEHSARAGRLRFDRRRETRSAAADDDYIEDFYDRAHAGLAARPALSPAMRPNTEPDISPVPPG